MPADGRDSALGGMISPSEPESSSRLDLDGLLAGAARPLFQVGMCDRGLQLVGKSLVRLPAWNVHSAPQHAAQGLELSGQLVQMATRGANWLGIPSTFGMPIRRLLFPGLPQSASNDGFAGT